MQGQVNQISKKCPMVALLFQTVVTVDRQLRPQMDELAKAIERSLRQTSKHIIIQRISDKPVHPDLIMSFFREKYNPDGLCRQWVAKNWKVEPCGRALQKSARVTLSAPRSPGAIDIEVDHVQGIVTGSDDAWEKLQFTAIVNQDVHLIVDGHYLIGGLRAPDKYSNALEDDYETQFDAYTRALAAEIQTFLGDQSK